MAYGHLIVNLKGLLFVSIRFVCSVLSHNASSAYMAADKRGTTNSDRMARLSVATLWTYVPIVARIIAIWRVYNRANASVVPLLALILVLQSMLNRDQ